MYDFLQKRMSLLISITMWVDIYLCKSMTQVKSNEFLFQNIIEETQIAGDRSHRLECEKSLTGNGLHYLGDSSHCSHFTQAIVSINYKSWARVVSLLRMMVTFTSHNCIFNVNYLQSIVFLKKYNCCFNKVIIFILFLLQV